MVRWGKGRAFFISNIDFHDIKFCKEVGGGGSNTLHLSGGSYIVYTLHEADKVHAWYYSPGSPLS